VIRIKPDVHVQCREFQGKPDLTPVKRDTERLLRNAQFRKTNPVTQQVAICWKKGLPKERDESWFLNSPKACGLCFIGIGRKMIRRLELTGAQALAALIHALGIEAGNRG